MRDSEILVILITDCLEYFSANSPAIGEKRKKWKNKIAPLIITTDFGSRHAHMNTFKGDRNNNGVFKNIIVEGSKEHRPKKKRKKLTTRK